MKKNFHKNFGILAVLLALLLLSKKLYAVEDIEKKPNIVLISIDTLRADHLSIYGYERKTSPNIDKFSQEGVVFLNAFSHIPRSIQSHMSIMTSLHHETHQVKPKDSFKNIVPLDKAIPTLAKILKNNGYITVAFTGGGPVNASSGLDKGFDSYNDYTQINDAIDWLNKNHKKNFFLFFHTYSVHDPYLPPKPYNRMYSFNYSGKIIDATYKINKLIHKEWNPGHYEFWTSVNKASNQDVNFLKAQYDADINYIDNSMVGVLLNRLKKLGIDKDTLIIILSDHGEAFGENNQFLHHDVFKGTLHVPLIMAYSKRLPKGLKIKQLVRLIDVMPTILDILNIKVDTLMQGKTLIPAIEGKDLDLSCYSEYTNKRFKYISIRTNQYCYIEKIGQHPKTEYYKYLYDRQKDPSEHKNIIDKHPKIAEKLRIQLKKLQKASIKQLNFSNSPKNVPIDDKAIQKLKFLGYF